MKKILVIALTLIQISTYCQIQDNEFVFTDTIQSEYLKERQIVHVYLPPDYYHSNDSYPLQVVLGKSSRTQMYYTISKYLSETYQMTSLNQLHTIPESIVVGLGHASQNNMEEYKKFVFTEVIPLIENKYRKCHYKSLIGHSVDGEFVLRALFSSESPFHAYYCTSPANSQYFINQLKKAAITTRIQKSKRKLLLVASHKDYFYKENIKLIDALNKIDTEGFIFKSIIKQKATHHSIFPVTITDALFFLYNNWYYKVPENNVERTTDLFIDHYDKLSQIIGLRIIPPEFDFYLLAYILNTKNHTEEKIKLLKKCKEFYPKAKNADAYLARTYYMIGDLENAEIHNQQSLAINPSNEFAKQTKVLIEKKKN